MSGSFQFGLCGCGLAWSRTEAFQASNPDSNSGSRTILCGNDFGGPILDSKRALLGTTTAKPGDFLLEDL
jgi:hypothetical protein